MKGRKKSPKKSPGRPDKGPDPKAAEGKFAPLIEELGRMKTRLESDASYLSTSQLSLQERVQREIEGELLRKEEDVRVDFDAAFRQRPQVLVEMVSALRRYGDADVMRNLVFAAETLYGDKLRELPGGIEFWEDLKREVAPLPHPPALTPSDLRIQRLQAIEIFREAIVSYDMISDTAAPAPAAPLSRPVPAVAGSAGPAIPEGPAAAPAAPGPEPGSAVPAGPAPAEPVPETPAPVTEAHPPQPAAPAIPVETPVPSPEGPPADEQARRLDQMAQRIRQQEEALKKDFDELLAREQRLLGLEKRLEEKERALLTSEEEAGKRMAGCAVEVESLRKREADLAEELAKTRELHQRTAGELEQAVKQAADAALAAGAVQELERALSSARQELEQEKSSRQKVQEGQRSDEERLREELREKQERLASEEHGQKARLEQAEREISARRTEISGREAALAEAERTLREQEKWLDEERRRMEEGRAAKQMPEAPAEMPSPPATAQQASISGGNILSRLASLAAKPPEARPAIDTPAQMPDIPAPEGETPEPRVLYKVKCPGCKNVIPVYTRERPLKIKCDACGKEGVLK